MKKAIANLSFSDLKVRYFTGRSILISDTGQGKKYQYRNGCMTALGDLEISEWREMITELIAYRSEQELQKQLYTRKDKAAQRGRYCDYILIGEDTGIQP